MTMTLDEAIKQLSDAAYRGSLTYNQEFKDALKLGIEALKLIQRERLLGVNPVETILPGETRE